MEESRTHMVALIGTIALHLAVVWWLAASPERTARFLNAIDMDVVNVTPPEPEAPPPPPPEPEPEPDPEPEARPVAKRRPAPEREPAPEPEPAEPPQDDPPVDTPPSPPVIDFGEQNFVSDGSGASWGMAATHGGSAMGVYRPGAKGSGAVRHAPTPPPRPSFDPVPTGELSRSPRLASELAHDYPERAKRQYVEGIVLLRVEIRANGSVRNVRIQRDPGGGLGEAAAREMRLARFDPALDRAGRPVDVVITYRYRYILED